MKKIIIVFVIFLFGCQSKEKPTSKVDLLDNRLAEFSPKPENGKLQNGDLIFHTSLSDQSMAIQIATNSKYSHMGIIYQEGGAFLVYEAVQPVKFTPLEQWIKRGKDGEYVVKRLKRSNELLTEEALKKMKVAGKKYLGKNYDVKFEWSDDRIYCSELVWKIYKEALDIEIGKLEKIKDFDLSDPKVQAKLKERYGENIPLEEPVITPDRMFKASNLITVEI